MCWLAPPLKKDCLAECARDEEDDEEEEKDMPSPCAWENLIVWFCTRRCCCQISHATF